MGYIRTKRYSKINDDYDLFYIWNLTCLTVAHVKLKSLKPYNVLN